MSTPATLMPSPLRRRLDAAMREITAPEGAPVVDFTRPVGEPALIGPDSVSWQVFRNPVALMVGGIAAVLLELAEPRVRSGVWDHTSFRTDPLTRMRRTGLAAMITVYGARSAAEAMIGGVRRAHAKVRGVTPGGEPYRANDPELLAWVQATAAFGFLEAYDRYVRPVSAAGRDRFYAEGAPAALLYGAIGAPRSEAELEALFGAMAPRLEGSAIVFDFLNILRRTPILPTPFRSAQGMLIRAAVEIVPGWTRGILGLSRRYGLRFGEGRLVRAMGAAADRVALESAPSSQACRRLGLPSDYLQQRARAPA